MTPTLLLAAGALVIGGYLFQHLRNQRRQQAQQRLSALEKIRGLRQLLEKVPQHRGMANAWLLGDASFAAKLQNLQRQIDADAAILTKLASGISNNTIYARIRRIEAQWGAIKQDLQRLSSSRSFALHCELVSEILFLINDLGEEGGLLDSDNHFAAQADAAINLLPLVTETQGQARGMATGAAAQGECEIPAQVKLRYLLERTRAATKAAEHQLQGNVQAQGLDGRLDESLAATEAFLQLLETRVLNAETIDIPSDEVFGAGSHAIGKSFNLLDQLINTLQQALTAEATRSARQWRLSQIAATALLAPAAWLVQLAM